MGTTDNPKYFLEINADKKVAGMATEVSIRRVFREGYIELYSMLQY